MVTLSRMRQYTVDTLTQMKDAGLVAASAAATVGGSAKVIDTITGGTGGTGAPKILDAVLVVDVSAIEIASNDELYDILVEGSDSPTFASGIEELACLRLGAHEVLTGGGDTDSTTGRYVVPFMNDRNGRSYRYLRVYTVVAGTIATGINYVAYITKP